jgi:alginate O-acetyltransferase complex protein AlgI
MLFNSWTFLVFLLLVFVGYYFGPPWLSRTAAGQTGWLTLASFVFYGWHTPWLVFLLAVSTFVNAEAARRLLDPVATRPQRLRVLWVALTFNLGALAFFKYAALLARLLLPVTLWEKWKPFVGNIPLPIGISFYTFQGISLVIDLWRAGAAGVPGATFPRTTAETVWFQERTWFFKSFFPQLISGPIVKAHEFYYQIGRKDLRKVDWNGALKHLVAGFFLKMVVADNLKEATLALKYPEFTHLPKLSLLALLYGFSFQIFADFCGYSMIAIGLAKLFGYELPINFRFPYISRSLTEFWRRWHISLSTWLRSYLYIPLGGNRHGPLRTYFNLFVVMFLGGLWHGAAWSYAVWGTAHGIFLAFERMIGLHAREGKAGVAPPFKGISPTQSDASSAAENRRNPRSGTQEDDRPWTALGVVRALVVFNVVSALWLLFKLPDFRQVLEYVRCLAHNPFGIKPQTLFVIGLFSLPVILMHLHAASDRWRARMRERVGARAWAWSEALGYAAMILLILVNSGTPGEFIYFQF